MVITDYDQPVTVLARNGLSEETTLADIVRRVIACPSLLDEVGILLMADHRLLTGYAGLAALHEAPSFPKPDNDG